MKRCLAVVGLLFLAVGAKGQCTISGAATEEVTLIGSAQLPGSLQIGSNDTLGFLTGSSYQADVANLITSNTGSNPNGRFVQVLSTGASNPSVAGGLYIEVTEHNGHHAPPLNYHWYLLELDKDPSGTTYTQYVKKYESPTWNGHYTLSTQYTDLNAVLPYYWQIVRNTSTGELDFQYSSNGSVWTTFYTETGLTGTQGTAVSGVYTYTGSGGYPSQSGEVQLSVDHLPSGWSYPTPNITGTQFTLPMLQASLAQMGVGFNPVSGTASACGSTFPGTVSVTGQMQFYQDSGLADSESVTQNYPSCSGQTSCAFSFNMPLNYPNSEYVETIAHGHQYTMGVAVNASAPGLVTGGLITHTVVWPAVP